MMEKEKRCSRLEIRFLCYFRESEQLLSKILGDRTVGFLRAKKESASTHRGQRVGIGFLEFRQTP